MHQDKYLVPARVTCVIMFMAGKNPMANLAGPAGGRGSTMNQTSDKKQVRELFVEGWAFMQTLGEGAYGE